MKNKKDFLPVKWELFAVWMANWVITLPKLAVKYNVSAAYLAQLPNDNEWTQYWAHVKELAKQLEKQLTDYMDEIAKNGINAPPPFSPEWELPPGKPPEIPPGLRARIREQANLIKQQKSIYSEADGELLGIVGIEIGAGDDDALQASAKFKMLDDFMLEVTFEKQGKDGLRVEFRFKGGEWQQAIDTGQSPREFKINVTDDVPQQIELRCILLEKYLPVGEWSPTYTMLIAP